MMDPHTAKTENIVLRDDLTIRELVGRLTEGAYPDANSVGVLEWLRGKGASEQQLIQVFQAAVDGASKRCYGLGEHHRVAVRQLIELINGFRLLFLGEGARLDDSDHGIYERTGVDLTLYRSAVDSWKKQAKRRAAEATADADFVDIQEDFGELTASSGYRKDS